MVSGTASSDTISEAFITSITLIGPPCPKAC